MITVESRETCWLTLYQVKQLLRTGELQTASNDNAALNLNINFIDRVASAELVNDPPPDLDGEISV